jgi:hypothetical protein
MMKRNDVSIARTDSQGAAGWAGAKARASASLSPIPIIGAVMLAAALIAGPIASAQNAPAAGEGAPAAAAKPAAGPSPVEFKPSMDDLMTMLLQPRHMKLYYAGEAKNWTLAGFELNELRGALARVGRTVPTYRNVSVDMAITTIIADKIKALDSAIKAKDSEEFSAGYRELTAACNTCHQALEHPFLKIAVPDAVNYPDQDFRP